MPKINRSALVPYTPEKMYVLVDNVLDYPNFLPWCRSSQEQNRTENEVCASVEIAKGIVNKSFTTHNRLQPHKSIEMQLVDGPFRRLHGIWQFKALGKQACKISLDLDFEFSNRLISMTLGPVFNQVANTLVDSFVAQAKRVYGQDR